MSIVGKPLISLPELPFEQIGFLVNQKAGPHWTGVKIMHDPCPLLLRRDTSQDRCCGFVEETSEGLYNSRREGARGIFRLD